MNELSSNAAILLYDISHHLASLDKAVIHVNGHLFVQVIELE